MKCVTLFRCLLYKCKSIRWRHFASSRRQRTRKALVSELKACSSSRNLVRGQDLHAEAVQNGHDSCIYVATALVNMYAKCGNMNRARQVFDAMKHLDVVSWTALILGYAENGEGVTALDLFAGMRSQGCAPNSITFVAVLKACTSFALEKDERGRADGLERGKQMHSQVGCHSDIYVQSTLIDMYAKCGSMADAREVFDSMKQPNVVAWNALLLGYAENGKGLVTLDLFACMKSRRCLPDCFTYVAVLKGCTSLALERDEMGKAEILEQGKRLQAEASRLSDIFVHNTLIDLYAKCGSMVDARQVFDSIKDSNVVSWTTLILGYAENGEAHTSLDMFARMRCLGCVPNSFTFLAALKACIAFATLEEYGMPKVECLERGRRIHSEMSGHPEMRTQNTLIDMYSKCGSMADAHRVFDSIKCPDVVSWTALIFGYAEDGDGLTALELFGRMRSQGCAPNSVTIVAALKACGSLLSLDTGSRIHAEISNTAIHIDEILLNCLVDFYAKCGNLTEAQRVFDSHTETRNFITWNALLAGYSRLGDDKAVFRLFQGMQDAGFQPNRVTCLCILTCCSHAGYVEKACEHFKAMPTKYGVAATAEHYNCMVDILGRSNKLDDAIALLRAMPWRPDDVTWMTILGACRKWKNVWIGKLAFKSLKHTPSAAYVLMAHLYGSKGMWDEQDMILSHEAKAQDTSSIL